MKIRTKITLWISGTALLSTLIFSVVVFRVMVQQPFQLIDRELAYMADALVRLMADAPAGNLSGMPYNPDSYWITVRDDRGKILYESQLTQYADLVIPGDKEIYFIEKHIPRSRIWLGQDDHDDVMFRVMVVHGRIRDLPVDIRIAKPIEGLEEDLIALAWDMGIGLLACVLLISGLSYVLAGRILRPVNAIIQKSREISDTSMDRRIPLPKSRDELHALSLALNRMFDRLENAFDQQKEFIRNASHELKSPITLLMLAQEDLLMNEDLPPSSVLNLTRQLDTTRRMSHLVKNLLDLSRMQQHEKLTLETVDLADLTAKVVEDYTEALAARGISVENRITGPLNVQGDPEKLFRLFVNLVDNAIRYNLEGEGRIALSAGRSGHEVSVHIANTGIPIPDSDLPRLFEQFFRVEKSRSLSFGGSGLGLAIAQKIVSLHQGNISIANGPDRTIRVTVRLPGSQSEQT